ncbi:acyltransferase family protein [Trinickia symbiotica]|nr:acyltransferase [Trinickia symbiotica]
MQMSSRANIADCSAGCERSVLTKIGGFMSRALPALTGLRFVAALAVFLFHFGAGWSERAHFPSAVTDFLKHGFFGVSVFFILSGFILSHQYAGRLNGVRDVVYFYTSRVARIYPVYLLALALAFPLTQRMSLASGATVLLMIQSWGPAWSDAGYLWVTQAWTLSVEVAFYLCFPILSAIVGRIANGYAVIGVVIASILMVAFALPLISPQAAVHHDFVDALLGFPLPLLRMVEFVYGMLLCQVFSTVTHWHHSRLTSSFAVSANILVIVGLLTSSVNSHWLSLAAVLFGLLIYQLAADRTWLSSLLSQRWALVLGGASYAFYLLQGPVRAWLKMVVPNESLGAAINPVALIVLSILVYRWFEEPARDIIKRSAGSLTRRRERIGSSVDRSSIIKSLVRFSPKSQR